MYTQSSSDSTCGITLICMLLFLNVFGFWGRKRRAIENKELLLYKMYMFIDLSWFNKGNMFHKEERNSSSFLFLVLILLYNDENKQQKAACINFMNMLYI